MKEQSLFTRDNGQAWCDDMMGPEVVNTVGAYPRLTLWSPCDCISRTLLPSIFVTSISTLGICSLSPLNSGLAASGHEARGMKLPLVSDAHSDIGEPSWVLHGKGKVARVMGLESRNYHLGAQCICPQGLEQTDKTSRWPIS